MNTGIDRGFQNRLGRTLNLKSIHINLLKFSAKLTQKNPLLLV